MHTDQHGWKRGGRGRSAGGPPAAASCSRGGCGQISAPELAAHFWPSGPRSGRHGARPSGRRNVGVADSFEAYGCIRGMLRRERRAPAALQTSASIRVHPWFSFRVQVQSLPQPPMRSRFQSLRKFVPSAPGSPAPSPPFGTEARAGERRRFAMVTRLAWAGHPSPRPSPRSCLTGRGRRPRYSLRRLRHKLSQRLITA